MESRAERPSLAFISERATCKLDDTACQAADEGHIDVLAYSYLEKAFPVDN